MLLAVYNKTLANRFAYASVGSVVTGRQAPLPGIEAIPGPTIATVPLRVPVKLDESISAFLERLQEQATIMIEFEQVGLQTIRSFNDDTDKASRFQTLLISHAEEPRQPSKLTISQTTAARANKDLFGSFALTIHTAISASGLNFGASFDSSIISTPEVRRMADQFQSVLRQLCVEEKLVGDIRTISDEDLKDIWQ